MLLPEHDGSWYMRISQTPLANGMEQALLVVNSVKLHLTAFKKDTCCLSVIYALLVDCQLKVRITRSGPFYTGISCFSSFLVLFQ